MLSLELGICHLKDFFNGHLNFATAELAIIEVLVCCATPSQLGQIFAASLKDAKYFGKNPTCNIGNRGVGYVCIGNLEGFHKAQKHPSAT